METLFIYLIKSSGLIAMFYLAYFALLRKETFFTSNRWFLLAGLITSVILPLVVFTKIVWIDPIPTAFDWSKIPVTNTVESEVFEINWYLVFTTVYSSGILAFLMKFAFDFHSLSNVLKGKTIQQRAEFKLIDINENVSPFSYFNSIVYNSSLYSDLELENILEHEKVHSSQNHTIDVLISRFFCIVFWFNPLVWLYKNAISQNLEFIADSEASKSISDKKAYQLTLLKITTQENCVAITNHFYQSLIKKRIVMLNKNQSNKRNYWKYASVLPLLGAFVFFFQVKVVAQEKIENSTKIDNLKVELHITSKSTSKELNSEKDFFKEEFNLEINFTEIKTNNDNEIIAIKVELKNKEGITKLNRLSGVNPINPFNVFAEKLENNKIKFGFSTSVNQNDKNHFELVNAIKRGGKKNNIIEKDLNFWTIDNGTNDGKEYLIVINGQKQSKNNKIKIALNEDILSENKLNPQESIQKYGKDGENGAIEIITGLEKNISIEKTTVPTPPLPPPPPKTPRPTKDIEKAIIILNGIRTLSTLEDLNKLDPTLIQSMNVLKGKAAVDKYGKNGENGAIEIITKENADLLKYNSPTEKKETQLNKGKIENTGNETVSSYKQYLEIYKTLLQARFSLERMKVKNEQAKVEQEKEKKSLKLKLFS